MFLFSDKNDSLRKKWYERGKSYARQVNEMVEFGETNGWENWKGKEPEDKRQDIADDVLNLLRAANVEGTTNNFRAKFLPLMHHL